MLLVAYLIACSILSSNEGKIDPLLPVLTSISRRYHDRVSLWWMRRRPFGQSRLLHLGECPRLKHIAFLWGDEDVTPLRWVA